MNPPGVLIQRGALPFTGFIFHLVGALVTLVTVISHVLLRNPQEVQLILSPRKYSGAEVAYPRE